MVLIMFLLGMTYEQSAIKSYLVLCSRFNVCGVSMPKLATCIKVTEHKGIVEYKTVKNIRVEELRKKMLATSNLIYHMINDKA